MYYPECVNNLYEITCGITIDCERVITNRDLWIKKCNCTEQLLEITKVEPESWSTSSNPPQNHPPVHEKIIDDPYNESPCYLHKSYAGSDHDEHTTSERVISGDVLYFVLCFGPIDRRILRAVSREIAVDGRRKWFAWRLCDH